MVYISLIVYRLCTKVKIKFTSFGEFKTSLKELHENSFYVVIATATCAAFFRPEEISEKGKNYRIFRYLNQYLRMMGGIFSTVLLEMLSILIYMALGYEIRKFRLDHKIDFHNIIKQVKSKWATNLRPVLEMSSYDIKIPYPIIIGIVCAPAVYTIFKLIYYKLCHPKKIIMNNRKKKLDVANNIQEEDEMIIHTTNTTTEKERQRSNNKKNVNVEDNDENLVLLSNNIVSGEENIPLNIHRDCFGNESTYNENRSTKNNSLLKFHKETGIVHRFYFYVDNTLSNYRRLQHTYQTIPSDTNTTSNEKNNYLGNTCVDDDKTKFITNQRSSGITLFEKNAKNQLIQVGVQVKGDSLLNMQYENEVSIKESSSKSEESVQPTCVIEPPTDKIIYTSLKDDGTMEKISVCEANNSIDMEQQNQLSQFDVHAHET